MTSKTETMALRLNNLMFLEVEAPAEFARVHVYFLKYANHSINLADCADAKNWDCVGDEVNKALVAVNVANEMLDEMLGE